MLAGNPNWDPTNFNRFNMINPAFHKQDEKDKFISPRGFVGAASDNYNNQAKYKNGEDPYRMISLNPEFVRISKGEDSPDPHDPSHIMNAQRNARNASSMQGSALYEMDN